LQTTDLETINRRRILATRSPDPGHGAVNHACQFGTEIGCAVLLQAPLCLLRRKPCGFSIELLRRDEPQDLAKMGVNRRLFLGQSRGRIPPLSAPATNVPVERSFFHPAMNPSLFESLESSCLSVSKPGLSAAFGENPAPFARP